MSIELITESYLGKYDRKTTVVITKMDGTQEFAARTSKHGDYVVSPLQWWRQLGIFQDDREKWLKVVNSPENALLLMKAGISPEDLMNVGIPVPHIGNVLEWFNVFRTVYPDYKNVTIEFFNKFMKNVNAVTKGNGSRNPFAVGRYIRRLGGSNFPLSDFTFLIGQDSWADACAALPLSMRSMAPTIKKMMMIGLTADVLTVISTSRDGGTPADYAVRSAVDFLGARGSLSATADSYESLRLLADIMTVVSREEIRGLFIADGVDQKRLRDLVVVDGIREPVQLESIFLDNTPLALAIGAL